MNPYLTQQLIAYIGNKRSLLGFIKRAVESTGISSGGFLDLFAGSGSVSRLAKTLGFSVYSNDWEFYSYVMNYSYIQIHATDLPFLFQDKGGLEKVLIALNSLKTPKKAYIGEYYSPHSENPDPQKERMFYSKENGLKIDAVREKIEEWYPEWNKEKFLLVSLLLYEAATHTNTSGVFKAYHHGFGGHGKDALSRILSPIILEKPCLYSSQAEEYQVSQMDANLLVKQLDWSKIQITYLDPPYNQHQYGSNYHLLNTIALWDKPSLSNDFKKDGKAAIRKDWIKTRSDYCYKEKAVKSFEDLMESVKSRIVMISYNTEGIIPFEVMVNILKKHGRVSLFTDKYVKYRGGRQSLDRKINNLEFLIMLERGVIHKNEDDCAIDELLTRKKLEVYQECVLDLRKLRKNGWKKIKNGFQKETESIHLENFIFKGFKGNSKKILEAIQQNSIDLKDKEIELLFKQDPVLYQKRILNSFKKIVHKKYQKEFHKIYLMIHDFYQNQKEFQKILESARKRKVLSF